LVFPKVEEKGAEVGGSFGAVGRGWGKARFFQFNEKDEGVSQNKLHVVRDGKVKRRRLDWGGQDKGQ